VTIKVNRIPVCILLVFLSSVIAAQQQTAPRMTGGISGTVRYPDGSPSMGAAVSAVTDCGDMGGSLVQESKTSADGTFYVPPFQMASCSRVRLTADKKDELWLPTGRDVFYKGENGTAPVVDASWIGPPTQTDIRLGLQGASVALRVRDIATGHLIRAELSVEKTPAPGSKFGSMLIATGRDGSPDTLLLPPGDYVISVTQYSCGNADYFTVSGPQKALQLRAGQRTDTEITVDVRLIKPVKSYSNPRGKLCSP
jgi:hypothetical protein